MLVRTNQPLILASTSVIRKQILQDVGLKFDVIAPDFDEEKFKKKNPQKTIKNLAMILAEGKALSVSKNFPNALVVGSDQVCEFEGKEISKSKNLAEALLQLQKMNGKIHSQNNATVVALNGKIIFRSFSRVKLEMRKMSKNEIENYVKIDKPAGCAGSYKYESFGKHLFKKVSGDYYSVLGLAIQPLLAFFHEKKLIEINH